MTLSRSRQSKRRSRHGNRRLTGIELLENRLLLATATWTGAGDGTSWADPNNWIREGLVELPEDGDDVVIPNVGDPGITGDVTVSFASSNLTLSSLTSAESIGIDDGSLTVTETSQVDGLLTLSGGTLTAGGELQLGGDFDWTGGRLDGAHPIILSADTEMRMTASSGRGIGSVTIQGAGIVTWTGGFLQSTSGIARPTFDVADFQLSGATEKRLLGVVLHNAGVMTTSGEGGLLSRNFSGTSSGSGIVNETGGLLRVLGDFQLASETTPSVFENLGAVEVSDGELSILGSAVWHGGSSLNGSVTLSDGTNTVAGNGFVADTVRLISGTLQVSGDWSVAERFDWDGGSIVGTGQTTLLAGAQLNIDGSGGRGVGDVTIQGQGVINWTDGFLQSASDIARPVFDVAEFSISGPAEKRLLGVMLHNAGVMTLGGFGSLVSQDFSGVDVGSGIVNEVAGTVRVGSDFTLQSHTTPAVFDNLGTVDLQTGAFSIVGNSTWHGGSSIIGDGKVSLGPTGTASIIGQGFTAENVALSGGTLQVSDDWTITGDFDWNGGTLLGDGTTTLSATATLSISGSGGEIGDIVIQGDGMVNWTEGTIQSLSFDTTSTPVFDVAFNVGGPGDKSLTNVVLITSGRTTLSGAGSFVVNNARGPAFTTGIRNLADGVFELKDGATIQHSGFGTAEVSNEGTFRQLTAQSPPFGDRVGFHSTGTIEVPLGQIDALSLDFGPDRYALVRPSATIAVSGNVNGTTRESASYDAAGRLLLNGDSQTVEVMGEDRGPMAAGFFQNFVVGLLELSQTSVTLVDQADNSAGASAEALYVDALVVPANSELDLAGLNLYARSALLDGTVIGGAVTIVDVPGVLAFNTPTSGTIQAVGEVDEWTFDGVIGQQISLIGDPGDGVSFLPLEPTLAQVRIELVSPSDVVIAAAESGSAGELIRLAGIRLAESGTYRVRVSSVASAPDATGNYRITLGDATLDTAPLVFNTRELGEIERLYSVDQWTFSGTANQVVEFDFLNATFAGIGFTLSGPVGWIGFENETGDVPLMTLPADGPYVLSADSAGQGTGVYAFRLNSATDIPLTLGVAEAGELTGHGSAHLYSVEIVEPNPLGIRFENSSEVDRVDVYVKRGAAPTRREFDLRSTEVAADQSVTVPLATAGRWFILVYGERVDTPSPFIIRADADSAFVNGLLPLAAPAQLDVELAVLGVGFLPGAKVELVASDGAVLTSQAAAVNSFEEITATFDLSAAAEQVYDVRVLLPGSDPLVLEDAFEVTSAGKGIFEASLIVPPALGRVAPDTLFVEYTNTGSAPLRAPLLVLQPSDPDSDRPLLTLDESRWVNGVWVNGTSAFPDGFETSVQIYAQGESPGILRPGERIQVPVYFAGMHTPDLSDDELELELVAVQAGDTTPFDWDGYLSSARSEFVEPAAWDAIVNNLVELIGPSWGDYIEMLSTNARYFHGLGKEVRDVGKLFDITHAEANGFSSLPPLVDELDAETTAPGLQLLYTRSLGTSITDRHAVGPFGRGWAAPSQPQLVLAEDGTVVFFENSESVRRFQPDRRRLGQFRAPPSETGTLVRITGGDFELTEADGLFRRFHGDGKPSFMEDTNGNRLTYSYFGEQLETITHSAGPELTFTYSPGGLIESITDSTGWTTTYAYNSAGTLLESVTDPRGTTRYSYVTDQGAAREFALASVENPSGVVRRFEYDSRGRLRSTYLSGDANRLDFHYDRPGTVTRVDGGGTVEHLSFDEAGRPVRVEDAAGNYLLLEYDVAGNLIRVRDALGREQELEWSSTGQLRSARNQLGSQVLFEPGGPNGQPLSFTDGNGNVHDFSYDGRGNRLSQTFPDGSIERASYDTAGNPRSLTNRRNETTELRYNAAGQVVEERLPNRDTVNYAYDALDRLVLVNDGGQVTRYEYYSDNRLQRVTHPNGRWLEYKYDANGRLSELEDHSGFTVGYVYDAAGRLQELRDEDDGPIVTYGYDAAGRLATETKANGTNTTYEYDTVGRIETVVHRRADGTENARFRYGYDILGRRTSMTSDGGTWSYSYDGRGQLTRSVFQSINEEIADRDLWYFYDPAGNRIRTIDNGVTITWQINELNQLSSSSDATTYEYDLDGNLIRKQTPVGVWTYEYDSQNLLMTAQGPDGTWDYEYDVFGNRTAATRDGSRTEYLLDPTGSVDVIGTYDTDGNRVHSFVHGLGLEATASTSNWHFYDFDALGSTTGVSGSDGSYVNSYAYTPFGQPLLSDETIDNPFEYVGQSGVMQEENGLLFMRARYYSPDEARFHSIDPLRILDFNFYAYADNRPTELTDPLGLQSTGGNNSCSCTCDRRDDLGNDDRKKEEDLDDLYDAKKKKELEAQHDIPVERPQEVTSAYLTDPSATGFALAGSARAGSSFSLTGSGGSCVPPGPSGTDDDTFSPGLTPGGPGNPSGDPKTTPLFGSLDPNEKLAAGGFGPSGFIAPDAHIPYTIKFENLGPGSEPEPENPATAPAQRVVIADQLSTDLDWDSLRFMDFGFGDTVVTFPEARQYHFGNLPVTIDEKSFDLEVELSFNSSSGVLRAVFQSIQPGTELPPSVLTGFLPPEDGTGIGQGFIGFSIQPIQGLATGVEIRNVAEIRFDSQVVIATNQSNPEDPSEGTDPELEALVTIDAGTPESAVTPLPATTNVSPFEIAWSGQDDAGGSGVGRYDVYVSVDDGPFELWLARTSETSAQFPGEHNRSYAFYSVARDNVGNQEARAVNADTSTRVLLPRFALESWAATSTGFFAEFSNELDPSTLNLFDTGTSEHGPPDVMLVGDTSGPVSGALVVGESRRSVTFVATAGRLPADTYTVTLRGADDGFRDRTGNVLDGDGDGSAGGDFVETFSSATTGVELAVPNFVRGPGQEINLPANTSNGIPISIGDGTGIRRATLSIGFNSNLLNITDVIPGANTPPGASVSVDTSTPNLAIVELTSPTHLPAGENVLVHLVATVPAQTASQLYSAQHVLDIHGITLLDGSGVEVAAIDNDGVHVAAFLGDVSGNQRVNAADASQLARVAVLLDDGFAALPLTDPRMVGDISGNRIVNAADASLIARFAALFPVPQIPPLPIANQVATGGVPLMRPYWAQPVPQQDESVMEGEGEPTIFFDAFWDRLGDQPTFTDISVLKYETSVGDDDSENPTALEEAIDELFTTWMKRCSWTSELEPPPVPSHRACRGVE